MDQSKFELVGYDRPLGRYPSPARPIVKNPSYTNDIEYLAVYLDDDLQMDSEPVHPKSKFIKLSPTQKQKFNLNNFDCRKHRLFAVSKSVIRFYNPLYEKCFFGGLLSDEDFSREDPFFRISLAKEVRDQSLLNRELDSAEQYLRQKNDEDLLWFLEREKSKLQELTATNATNRQTSAPKTQEKNRNFMKGKVGNPRKFYQLMYPIAG